MLSQETPRSGLLPRQQILEIGYFYRTLRELIKLYDLHIDKAPTTRQSMVKASFRLLLLALSLSETATDMAIDITIEPLAVNIEEWTQR